MKKVVSMEALPIFKNYLDVILQPLILLSCGALDAQAKPSIARPETYFTVTDFAKFLGLSGSNFNSIARKYDKSWAGMI